MQSANTFACTRTRHSHQSAEVTMASFYQINRESSRLPSTLSALEEQSFLFQLQLQDKDEEDSSEVGRHPADQLLPHVPFKDWNSSTGNMYLANIIPHVVWMWL